LRGQELPKVDAIWGSRILKAALVAKESARTGSVCRVTI
jgi:hypothetical protein